MQGLTISRAVWYRSRTGNYTVPAIVTATVDTLYQPGVDAGFVPPLSSETHVHLAVFTPGIPGKRKDADDFLVESPHGRSENVAGTYQEFDVPFWEADGPYTAEQLLDVQPPGTWIWPPRV